MQLLNMSINYEYKLGLSFSFSRERARRGGYKYMFFLSESQAKRRIHKREMLSSQVCTVQIPTLFTVYCSSTRVLVQPMTIAN